jgi:hypothetical protein
MSDLTKCDHRDPEWLCLRCGWPVTDKVAALEARVQQLEQYLGGNGPLARELHQAIGIWVPHDGWPNPQSVGEALQRRSLQAACTGPKTLSDQDDLPAALKPSVENVTFAEKPADAGR